MCSKFYKIIILLLFLTTYYAYSQCSVVYEGVGTKDNPFKVSTVAQFAYMMCKPYNEGMTGNIYFELVNDIVTYNYRPVMPPASNESKVPYKIYLNGNFHRIHIDLNIENFMGGKAHTMFYDNYDNLLGRRGFAGVIDAHVFAKIENLVITGSIYGNWLGWQDLVSPPDLTVWPPGWVSNDPLYINATTISGDSTVNVVNLLNISTVAAGGNSCFKISARGSQSTMINCINAGNIDSSIFTAYGIVNMYTTSKNCLNIGSMRCFVTPDREWNNLNGSYALYRTNDKGFAAGIGASSSINCINAGWLCADSGAAAGIATGTFYSNSGSSTVSKNLNTGVVMGTNASSIAQLTNIGSATFSSNYYDRQMSPSGGINGLDIVGQAEGKPTTNTALTGAALQSVLGADYVYEDSMYPRLKCFDTMLSAPDVYRKAGYVGASPVFLHMYDEEYYDTYNNITNCFKVSMKHGVSWSSSNGRVSIDAQGNVILLSLGSDTLTCSIMTQYGSISKQVPITIVNVACKFDVITKPSTITEGTTTPDTTLALWRDRVVITAVGADCYSFLKWVNLSGDSISNKRIDTIIVVSDTTLVAVFQRDTFNLSLRINPSNTGTAMGSGKYACGTVVAILSTSEDTDNCWHFMHWTNESGDTISTIPYDHVTLTSDSILIANFSKNTYTLTLSAIPMEFGTVNGTNFWSEQYNCGDTADITAVAFSGYNFINWSFEDGLEYSTNATDKIIINVNIVLIGHFEKIADVGDTLHLILSSNPSNAGVLSGSGYYKEDDTVTIAATARTCYRFVNWTDTYGNVISADATTKIIIKKDTLLRANFAVDSFNVALKINSSNAGTVMGSGRFECGSQTSITAIGNECFEFINWTSEASNIISADVNALITVDRDTILTANFNTESFTLTLVSDQPTPYGGSVYGAGKYACKEEVTINAVADLDYTFFYWTENGSNISNDATYTFTMKKSRTLTAKFVSNTVELRTLTLKTNPLVAGTTKGSGKYEDSTNVEISATITDDCYHFVSWTDNNNTIISKKIIDTIFIISDTFLTANFARDTFSLTTIPNPLNAGTAMGSGRYICGDSAIITAVANADYQFNNWTDENCDIISTQEIAFVMINGNLNITANFTKNPQPSDTTLTLTLRASEHKLIDPRVQNYEIPIYITSNENISDLVIGLHILINANVFYPKSTNNGAFTSQLIGEIFDITLKDVRIANLLANKEEILLKINGDMILGNTDTSGIIIRDVTLNNALLIKELQLINGCITTIICTDGGDRLISVFNNPQGIFVDKNPVSDILHITCNIVEKGNYTIEAFDLMGNSMKIKEFVVTQTKQNIFNFDIPIYEYSAGAYAIIMTAPSKKYTSKFIVIKQ